MGLGSQEAPRKRDSLSPDQLLGLLGASKGIFMEGGREGPHRPRRQETSCMIP